MNTQYNSSFYNQLLLHEQSIISRLVHIRALLDLYNPKPKSTPVIRSKSDHSTLKFIKNSINNTNKSTRAVVFKIIFERKRILYSELSDILNQQFDKKVTEGNIYGIIQLFKRNGLIIKHKQGRSDVLIEINDKKIANLCSGTDSTQT